MIDKKEKMVKSSFFFNLYGIPSITWLVISLLAMIPDKTDPDPLTWGDLIIADIVLLSVWFALSFVITLIVNGIKKNKSMSVNEVNYETKPDKKVVVKPEEVEAKEKNQLKEEKVVEKPKKRANEKYLFVCENILDSYEYKKMAKYFPKRMYWVLVIRGTFLNLILSAIIAIFAQSWIATSIFFIIYQTYLMVIYKVRLEHFAEKVFNTREKRGEIDTNLKTEFYDDYLIRKSDKTSITIDYSEISKCIENDTNFYLEYSQRNMILIIQKNRCELELISFIRNTFKDLENHLGDGSSYKGVKKYHHPNFIKNGMIILLLITIASLWGALWSVSLVNKINPQHGFNFIKNTWVFWCWLPIPILSIILGFKYKNAGFKCTKNIVAGFIIGFLLLIYGSFCLFPTFSEDYSKIDTYRNIIDAELPDNGDLEIQNWDSYFDEDKTEYTIINAYYDKEDVSNFVSSIENNDNWVLSKKIKSELKILIPSQLRSDNDAYFSIYNSTTNQYNTLPDTSGDYEIYAMKYDRSDKQLEIHKFKYSYNK